MDDFEKLYKEYYPRVYAFLYKLCRDCEMTEEMTQDTFYELYKSLHKYNGSCKLFTFIASIAKNVYYKYVRKKHIEYIDIELLKELQDSADTPEEACLRKMWSKEIRRVIDMLPQNYRDVVVLRVYADLAFPDIANALGISTSSAKVIFHRAKKIISEELFERNDL
ncbi:MAG: sigma-70 family RNA polymerase sigma factor [Clostridia bacterium]|nr:sigma-70 family RNA polymerase sigma factor [Clostridia bacterium]